MTLIDCPECAGRVSSHAWACPHCGFPVLEYGQQALEDVTGSDQAKTGRQRSALTHLDKWARAYTATHRGAEPFADPEERRERFWLRLVSGGLALIVAILALLLLYGSVSG